MNKRILRTLYPVFIIVAGVLLALISAITSGTAVSAGTQPDLQFNPYMGWAAMVQASTPTPVVGAVSRAGSTDGIMLLGVIIVIIVLVPILINRNTWTK
jgi:hypothetical protein